MNNEDNNVEYVSMATFRWEARKRKVIGWFKGGLQRLKYIWDTDRELCLFAIPGIAWLVRRIFKSGDQRREDYHRNRQQYDRSADVWYDLKRPMTNTEKIEFAQRRRKGESVLDILKDMKLIKR